MVWTPEQTGRFLQRARTHRLYALYRLIGFRGLRRDEAYGLRWPDLDLALAENVIRAGESVGGRYGPRMG